MKKIIIGFVFLFTVAYIEYSRPDNVKAQSYQNSNANSAVVAAVSVSTTPTLIPVTGLIGFDREMIRLQNNHNSNVLYVTFTAVASSTTAAAQGYKLAAGASTDINVSKSVTVYVTLAADSGTSDVIALQTGYKGF